jgi:uncharacterized protein (TIGR02145 family)
LDPARNFLKDKLIGTVRNIGEEEITQHGFCWGVTTDPTTSGETTQLGATNARGSFTSIISNLTADTKYYVRAYVITSAGTEYGKVKSFTSFAPGLPAITTSGVSNITQNSAQSGGVISDDGGAQVTARGVCWGTSQIPTISESHTTDGSGTGSFTSQLTGLECNTTYYVRAYATNSAGTAYGAQVSFNTSDCPPGMPTVTTAAISNVTETSAQGGGNVTDDGGNAVTARGVCWSTSQNPVVTGSHTTDGGGTGSFTSQLTGLVCSTTYYVKAYATNSVGTAYGAQRSFKTSDCPVELPTVTTAAIGNITRTTAEGGGNVTDDGGGTVSARGVCWSTSQNPTISGSHSTDGSGPGSFTSTLSGLACGTSYYVRAYATNEAGTAYGAQTNFSTSNCIVPPTVTTNDATNVTDVSAEGGGNVTDDGGGTVSARGVCWGTSHNPTISGSHTNDGTGTGTFISNIEGLSPSTTYYLRAYATNSAGTNYGDEKNFTTKAASGSTVTDYDGNIYPTVQIGSQTWMAGNLKVTHYEDGSAIPLVEGTSAWDGMTTSSRAYCWYNNSTANRDTYGGLYSWAGAMKGAASSSSNPSGVQGVCPDGWHLPSDSEWTVLTDYLGGLSNAGGKMKEAGLVHWNSPNVGANNASGFTALPGGNRYYSGSFDGIGNGAIFWSTTESNSSNAWVSGLNYNSAEAYSYDDLKRSGFSVRCVKN